MLESSPAPDSTSTSMPRCTSSRTPSGVIATRCSSVLISRGTPTITLFGAFGAGAARALPSLLRGIPAPRRSACSSLDTRRGFTQHRAQDVGDLVELAVAGDERWRQLNHWIAAVVGAGDEAGVVQRRRDVPAQQCFGL